MSVIYRMVLARAALQGMQRSDLAAGLNISLGTLRNKLAGETPWTWPECIMVRKLVRFDGPLEDLFAEFPQEPDELRGDWQRTAYFAKYAGPGVGSPVRG